MFARLVASAGKRSPFRSPAVIAGSIGAHIALLALIVWASTPSEAAEPEAADIEEVTYIDITEIPPPPETVFEEPPEEAAPPTPAAEVPNTRSAQPRRTAQRPAAAATDEPAGFQELRPPAPVLGLPPADPTVDPIRAEDFGGRGAIGGTASGTPAAGADSGRIGSARQGAATGPPGGPPTGTFSSNMVDRTASLTNRQDIVNVLQRLYPRRLADRGTMGSVVVQFVVSAQGRVDMSTVQVISSTDELFTEATKKALQEFRFRPARKGEHNVRMLTVLPVEWKLDRD